MQRTPAGLPSGMPGIGELMDGAVQQAPQSGRQSMGGDAIDGLAQVQARALTDDTCLWSRMIRVGGRFRRCLDRRWERHHTPDATALKAAGVGS